MVHWFCSTMDTHTHTHTYSHIHTHSLTHTNTHTHSLTLSLSHTHTHTHTHTLCNKDDCQHSKKPDENTQKVEKDTYFNQTIQHMHTFSGQPPFLRHLLHVLYCNFLIKINTVFNILCFQSCTHSHFQFSVQSFALITTLVHSKFQAQQTEINRIT